ncbi:potassium-transporting ATPase subunit F [Trichococcus sp.]
MGVVGIVSIFACLLGLSLLLYLFYVLFRGEDL